ncbi:nitrate- and nitrite sensing domain-containing protein [Streptomyces sp. NPDC017673]|uniref:sensor histidine kinase n=1 Tax=unclassified Streptomyces TaxID=2593676 RepID=UPI0037A9509E
MRSPRWNIRSRITALLLLPLLSLTVLWTYAAYLSLGDALTLRHVDTIGNHLARPLGEVFIGLQRERQAGLVYLASPRTRNTPSQPAQDFSRARAVTDTAVRAFLREADDDGVRGAESAQVHRTVVTAEHRLDSLGRLRRGVEARTAAPDAVLRAYTGINASIAEAFDAMTILPDSEAQRFGQALYTHTLASDLLSQADALISASASTRRLNPTTYAAIVQDAGAAEQFDTLALSRYPADQRAPYERLAARGQPLAQVVEMERRLAAAGPRATRLPFSTEEWRKAYDTQWERSNQLALDDISVVFTLTGPPAQRALWRLVAAGVFGLIALVVSVVLSVRLGRSLVGDVARLHDSARNLTDDQLRDVVGRLRRGDRVDVTADMTRPVFVHHEMARLGEAFFALQVTAVDLAAEDVRLHRSISDVFVNLARRSQALVQRQLGLLESMERHEEDARRLDELFRLDQMATRLRRYAEGLIIVSGGAPGRVWRHAVPVVDVVRGAIAETDDYRRVAVLPVPHVGVAGHVVADVVHLLAELIENAQNFSPERTQVRIGVSLAAGGLVIEIDDRGLGMDAGQLHDANLLFTEPTDLSLLDSTRLGLVTVGRLAQRHGIGVALRDSPYGGVTAIVRLPDSLLEAESARDSDTGPVAVHRSGPLIPRQGGHGPYDHRPETGSSTCAPGTTAHVRPARPSAPADGSGPPPRQEPAVTDPPLYDGPHHGPGDVEHLGLPAEAHTEPPYAPVPSPDSGLPYGAGAPDPQTLDGLPRRVRQASLAPELRQGAAPSTAPVDWSGTTAHPAPTGTPDHPWEDTGPPPEAHRPPWPGHDDEGPGESSSDRRPERVRSLMSALQTGLARGRQEGWDPRLDEAGFPSLPGTLPPAHHQHTTPERGTPR